ncbi:ferredoxin--NADP reductase [Hymenobacter sp. 15J16-1T3B]|uniref:ferredoxin--NADP reductase n=1 Tax=Hymenobacter sp. 15J16-1T3B TaxID=2886941 RepID=UPI001D12D87C|nr:ferredoxin--NADP reductase [Hymenobacter sp. 15J16-1T3B]MCC3159449.1 ferredoxin--NADP reductase [Hymenobacter sp. 15J16-1T3B]
MSTSPYLTLTVVELTRETADAITIHLERADRQPVPSQPGQFLTLIVPCGSGKRPERRSYSLSSTPADAPRLSVTVKRVPGGLVSNHLLDTVRVGQTIEAMAPLGNFTLEANPQTARQLVLIGAGSGITPLMSILKTVLQQEPQSQVLLVYGNRNEDTVIFREQLKQLEQQYAGRFEVEHVFSQPKQAAKSGGGLLGRLFGGGSSAPQPAAEHQHTGRLNRTMLLRVLEQRWQTAPAQAEYYMCGPEGMMAEAKAALELLGVPADRIRRESFVASADSAEAAAAQPEGHGTVMADDKDEISARKVTIQYEGTEYVVEVQPNQTMLEAALDQDIDLPYSCQAGLCTACRGKCLTGKVHLDEREGLSDREIQQGYVLMCVGHPLTDDVVIEID